MMNFFVVILSIFLLHSIGCMETIFQEAPEVQRRKTATTTSKIASMMMIVVVLVVVGKSSQSVAKQQRLRSQTQPVSQSASHQHSLYLAAEVSTLAIGQAKFPGPSSSSGQKPAPIYVTEARVPDETGRIIGRFRFNFQHHFPLAFRTQETLLRTLPGLRSYRRKRKLLEFVSN